MKTFILAILFLALAGLAQAQDKRLNASWSDNSTNENGFRVERRIGSVPTFAVVNTTGPNITNYTDNGLQAATNYCYRVAAFNAAGQSTYSNEACLMTPATLTIAKAGNGAGVVTAPGINCGVTCSAEIQGGAMMALTAAPNADSVFAGWSGDPDCGDGNLTMNANKACTATFNLKTTPVAPGTLIITAIGADGKPVTIIVPGQVVP